jgi:hypothetical protein
MEEVNYLDLNSPINEKYEKFFASFKEADTLPIHDWKASHILAYFCKKYYEHYNTPYQFKYNNPSPVKSFEIFHIKKLTQSLSKDPKIIKDYIDYIFNTKVKSAKRKLTSISFMVHENVVNPYKMKFLFNTKTDRSTVLPDHIKKYIIDSGFQDIITYGDFAFFHLASKNKNDLRYKSLLLGLIGLGFNPSILETIT